jgi:alpha-ribazole phosphatase
MDGWEQEVKQLLLVRHGEADGIAPGALLGRTDPSLSERGRRQCAHLRALVPSGASTAYLCSPLARARQTAAIVTWGRDLSLEIDPDLSEIEFGEWEGLSFDQIERRYPEQAEQWSRFTADFAFPGGESLLEFRTRIERVGDRLMAANRETLVVFTHGGVIRALICHFLGLDLRDYLLFDVGPAAVATLHLWDGQGVLAGLSQTPGDPGRTEV